MLCSCWCKVLWLQHRPCYMPSCLSAGVGGADCNSVGWIEHRLTCGGGWGGGGLQLCGVDWTQTYLRGWVGWVGRLQLCWGGLNTGLPAGWGGGGLQLCGVDWTQTYLRGWVGWGGLQLCGVDWTQTYLRGWVGWGGLHLCRVDWTQTYLRGWVGWGGIATLWGGLNTDLPVGVGGVGYCNSVGWIETQTYLRGWVGGGGIATLTITFHPVSEGDGVTTQTLLCTVLSVENISTSVGFWCNQTQVPKQGQLLGIHFNVKCLPIIIIGFTLTYG